MKIYNKASCIWGLIFLLGIPVLAFNRENTEWYQWFLCLGLGGRFLYAGLSKEGSEQQTKIEKNYAPVAKRLFGKYATIKTNLPYIVTGVFLIAGLLLRFVFDIVISAWAAACFVVVLTISFFYSIGLDKAIKEEIERSE